MLSQNAMEKWQVDWIDFYGRSRAEQNEKIKNAKLLNGKQAKQIAKLLQVKAKQNELLAKLSKLLDKKNARINKYKSRRSDLEDEFKLLHRELVDSSTQTEQTAAFQSANVFDGARTQRYPVFGGAAIFGNRFAMAKVSAGQANADIFVGQNVQIPGFGSAKEHQPQNNPLTGVSPNIEPDDQPISHRVNSNVQTENQNDHHDDGNGMFWFYFDILILKIFLSTHRDVHMRL